jgi:molybdopterin-guanine dinucleotide biosynthesis protein A
MVCCVLRGEPSAVPVRWVGAILAGDTAKGDLRHVGEAVRLLRPQVPVLIITTDGDPERVNTAGVPVAAAASAGSAGMILAALDWTAEHAWATPWVATILAASTPTPPDLVARLSAAVTGCEAEAACVAQGGRLVFEHGLWPVMLRRDLRRIVADKGSLADWVRGLTVAIV